MRGVYTRKYIYNENILLGDLFEKEKNILFFTEKWEIMSMTGYSQINSLVSGVWNRIFVNESCIVILIYATNINEL